MGNRSGLSRTAGSRGQGMTEYLIIIALIAIAAIGVYSFFGQSAVRQPAGEIEQEPTGKAVAKEAAGAPAKAPAKAAEAKGGEGSKSTAPGK